MLTTVETVLLAEPWALLESPSVHGAVVEDRRCSAYGTLRCRALTGGGFGGKGKEGPGPDSGRERHAGAFREKAKEGPGPDPCRGRHVAGQVRGTGAEHCRSIVVARDAAEP